MVPELHAAQHEAAELRLSGRRHRLLEDRLPVGIIYREKHCPADPVRLPDDGCRPVRRVDARHVLHRIPDARQKRRRVQHARRQVFQHDGANVQILHMELRPRDEGHAPEDPREPEEVLVLQERGRRALVHFHREDILLIPDIRGQVKFGRREGVLRIADEFAVDPDEHGLLDALEQCRDPFPRHLLRQVERQPVGADRVVVRIRERPDALRVLREHVRRPSVIFPFPGIHRVDVMDPVKARDLHMSGDRDLRESCEVRILPVEVRGAGRAVHRPLEIPLAVERRPERARSGIRLRRILVKGVVAVRRHLSDPKDRRVVEPPDICFH